MLMTAELFVDFGILYENGTHKALQRHGLEERESEEDSEGGEKVDWNGVDAECA